MLLVVVVVGAFVMIVIRTTLCEIVTHGSWKKSEGWEAVFIFGSSLVYKSLEC